jgi:hypothetical protein
MQAMVKLRAHVGSVKKLQLLNARRLELLSPSEDSVGFMEFLNVHLYFLKF